MWVDVKTEDCQKLVCDGRTAITSPQRDCAVVVTNLLSKYEGNCQTYCGAQQDGILDCVAHYDEYEDTCQPQGYDLGCDYVSESSDNICVCGLRAPTPSPTSSPSDAPTATPSDAPTATPSDAPTVWGATATPSDAPSATPSEAPSATPSDSPSVTPSDAPTGTPSDAPTGTPSDAPSGKPSDAPSAKPSDAPSAKPSDAPSAKPSASPTTAPTNPSLDAGEFGEGEEQDGTDFVIEDPGEVDADDGPAEVADPDPVLDCAAICARQRRRLRFGSFHAPDGCAC